MVNRPDNVKKCYPVIFIQKLPEYQRNDVDTQGVFVFNGCSCYIRWFRVDGVRFVTLRNSRVVVERNERKN